MTGQTWSQAKAMRRRAEHRVRLAVWCSFFGAVAVLGGLFWAVTR